MFTVSSGGTRRKQAKRAHVKLNLQHTLHLVSKLAHESETRNKIVSITQVQQIHLSAEEGKLMNGLREA